MINSIGPQQKYFAHDALRSYFNECQKKRIHFLNPLTINLLEVWKQLSQCPRGLVMKRLTYNLLFDLFSFEVLVLNQNYSCPELLAGEIQTL